MVGFGRTEKWLSLSCTEFRALSNGHGLEGPCFNGGRNTWVFHDFLSVFFDRIFDPFSDRSKCHENAKWTCSDFGFSGWEWYQMIGLGRGEVPGGFSARKTRKSKEHVEKYFSDFPENPDFFCIFPIQTARGQIEEDEACLCGGVYFLSFLRIF